MMRILLFFMCTAFFLRISWKALANPGTHGFYRFFVFEGIALLVLLNYPHWFSNPLSPQHVLSWLFLAVSIFLVFQSVTMLKQRGGHAERDEMPENFSFENTVHVVEDGLYRYIRHPMYSSLLFLGWGAFLKQITPLNIFLVLVVTVFITIAAKVEERENIRFFGADYEGYMQRTKMFVPWLL